MTYYILFKNEPKEHLMYDASTLGETTDDGKKFYPNRGFKILVEFIHKYPHLLEGAVCYDDRRHEFTIEQFLNEIKNCKIQQH